MIQIAYKIVSLLGFIRENWLLKKYEQWDYLDVLRHGFDAESIYLNSHFCEEFSNLEWWFGVFFRDNKFYLLSGYNDFDKAVPLDFLQLALKQGKEFSNKENLINFLTATAEFMGKGVGEHSIFSGAIKAITGHKIEQQFNSLQTALIQSGVVHEGNCEDVLI